MRWSIRILIAVVILAFLSFGGLLLYNAAYARGQNAGYSSGYSAGYTAGEPVGYGQGEQVGYGQGRQVGYNQGRQDGYDIGTSDGRAAGYDAGYIVGERDGFTGGYAAGRANGYRVGYGDGVRASLGHGYTLSDPYREELVKFLIEDRTDEKEFVEGSYVAIHYAMEVNNKAEDRGWRSAFVLISYAEGEHAVVAFDTVDKGLLYFEPQTDQPIEPEIGQQYGDGGIVQDILIIW